MITFDRIYIEGAFGIRKIADIKISILPNRHAVAVIEGICDKTDELHGWQMNDSGKQITIRIRGEEKPLFAGVLSEVLCKCETEYYIARLTVVSGTVLLDRKKISASYQNVRMNYKDVLAKVTKAQGASYIWGAGNDREIAKPIIQYAETDWTFVKRLASYLGVVVYPVTDQAAPSFYFGLPKGRRAEIKAYEYRHGISRDICMFENENTWKPSAFEYYIIQSHDRYEIGMEVVYNKAVWTILEIQAEMIKSVLTFTYTLGRTQYRIQNKIYNPVFCGMSILGKVLSTAGETVKLHLDIDVEQKEAEAYPYLWTPDTGSVMYCMPKAGTTVSLYFPDEDETKARAVNCVRENGSTCSAMQNTENRALNTEHGKQMLMTPDTLGFDVKEKGHALHIRDNNGIALTSNKAVRMISGEQIEVKGKRVMLETKQAMCLVRNPKNGENISKTI